MSSFPGVPFLLSSDCEISKAAHVDNTHANWIAQLPEDEAFNTRDASLSIAIKAVKCHLEETHQPSQVTMVIVPETVWESDDVTVSLSYKQIAEDGSPEDVRVIESKPNADLSLIKLRPHPDNKPARFVKRANVMTKKLKVRFSTDAQGEDSGLITITAGRVVVLIKAELFNFLGFSSARHSKARFKGEEWVFLSGDGRETWSLEGDDDYRQEDYHALPRYYKYGDIQRALAKPQQIYVKVEEVAGYSHDNIALYKSVFSMPLNKNAEGEVYRETAGKPAFFPLSSAGTDLRNLHFRLADETGTQIKTDERRPTFVHGYIAKMEVDHDYIIASSEGSIGDFPTNTNNKFRAAVKPSVHLENGAALCLRSIIYPTSCNIFNTHTERAKFQARGARRKPGNEKQIEYSKIETLEIPSDARDINSLVNIGQLAAYVQSTLSSLIREYAPKVTINKSAYGESRLMFVSSPKTAFQFLMPGAFARLIGMDSCGRKDDDGNIIYTNFPLFEEQRESEYKQEIKTIPGGKMNIHANRPSAAYLQCRQIASSAVNGIKINLLKWIPISSPPHHTATLDKRSEYYECGTHDYLPLTVSGGNLEFLDFSVIDQDGRPFPFKNPRENVSLSLTVYKGIEQAWLM